LGVSSGKDASLPAWRALQPALVSTITAISPAAHPRLLGQASYVGPSELAFDAEQPTRWAGIWA
jgi:hypothetical protein